MAGLIESVKPRFHYIAVKKGLLCVRVCQQVFSLPIFPYKLREGIFHAKSKLAFQAVRCKRENPSTELKENISCEKNVVQTIFAKTFSAQKYNLYTSKPKTTLRISEGARS